ncbi:MAG: DNA-protecting protein DprA [Bacteroidales bacterium]|nr:DNA-protecting protein DprA [Bacteroidales bacterium]
MKDFAEKSYHCALNRIFGFKPKIGLALISNFGSASEVFRMNIKELEALLGPHSGLTEMICARTADEAAEELMKLEDMNIRFVGWNEDEYPAMLHECEDAPIGLYVKSVTPMKELWKPCRRIAVVGTRDLTPYGREWCERIVCGFSSSSEAPVIVSGLALGTDICAHRSALENGLPTIACMATGPETVYPYRHREFAERLGSTPGCALVTDYPPGTAPLAIHFLRRNRIIAGLSDATILIESRIKGGGMMTSRLAFSYDRDVYALPGRIDDPCSQGCNLLIRSKIAEPITSVKDLMSSLAMKSTGIGKRLPHEEVIASAYRSRETAENISRLCRMIGIIRNERGISLDEISGRTGFGFGTTMHLAGLLETDGFISIDILQRCCIEVGKFR